MGFFDGMDVDDIPDDPNELPNNTYRFRVMAAELKPTTAGDKTGITFKYQILEGSYSTFYQLVDWVRVPDSGVRKDELPRMLSYLKMRLLAFGFSIEEVGQFSKDTVTQCVGKEFFGTTNFRRNKDNTTSIRVTKFDPIQNAVEDEFADSDI